MLCANSYTREYVDACRSRIAAQVAAYRALVSAARARVTVNEPLLNAALDGFEPHFFNSMVLALDSHFVHRARAIEKKDGNPLNEVRMLSSSIMNNGSVMCADKMIKYNPAKSVLKRRIGDKITLNEADCRAISPRGARQRSRRRGKGLRDPRRHGSAEATSVQGVGHALDQLRDVHRPL